MVLCKQISGAVARLARSLPLTLRCVLFTVALRGGGRIEAGAGSPRPTTQFYLT